MIGRAGPSPPPPRRGFAILEPTPPPKAKDAPALGEPSPRVEPAFAASRRSLTAVSCDSKLQRISWGWAKSLWQIIPMICCCELLLAVLQQAFQRLDALVAGNQLALSDSNLLLERAVLLNKLPLHDGELLKVALQEHHLFLLCTVVGCAEHVIVLFAGLIKGDLEFNDL